MIDLSKYHAKLVAESRKNLLELEDSISKLTIEPTDRFARETAFRAAHSIKGGAAMFGFDRIAALAEDLELLLHRIVSGQKEISQGLLDAASASKATLSDLFDSIEMKVDLVPGYENGAKNKLAACA
jgi:two-component system, chemotaxis family, sensor kinase CheA